MQEWHIRGLALSPSAAARGRGPLHAVRRVARGAHAIGGIDIAWDTPGVRESAARRGGNAADATPPKPRVVERTTLFDSESAAVFAFIQRIDGDCRATDSRRYDFIACDQDSSASVADCHWQKPGKAPSSTAAECGDKADCGVADEGHTMMFQILKRGRTTPSRPGFESARLDGSSVLSEAKTAGG